MSPTLLHEPTVGAVGIATDYGLDGRGVGVRVPVVERFLPFPRLFSASHCRGENQDATDPQYYLKSVTETRTAGLAEIPMKRKFA
jgi:hypothetical protein